MLPRLGFDRFFTGAHFAAPLTAKRTENPAPHCQLCGGAEMSLTRVPDSKSRETLDIGLCRVCGFVQQATIPSDDDLRIYYSHHYREDYKSTLQPKPKHVFRAGRVALERVQRLQRVLPASAGRRLLDIGAGGGEFVYVSSRSGFDARGIEPNLGYSEYARREYGVEVRTETIDDLEPGAHDIVTLFHVLEHLARPFDAMQRLYDSLTDQGLLYVEVPNILQADASPHNIYFRAHLYYYSRSSLLAVTSRHFEPIHVEDRGNLIGVFRKRAVPLSAPQLPTRADAAFTEQRLASKGWIEYLFVGGGLLKPIGRLRKTLNERRAVGKPARRILDELVLGSAQRT